MQTLTGKLYTAFAKLLEYPWDGIMGAIDETIDALKHQPHYPPQVKEELENFKKELSSLPLDEIQGIYSYTFELSSDYTLDMGYHLYDGFKRAEKLLFLKETMKGDGFPFDDVAKGELPDNLLVMLKFLDFTLDANLKKELTEDLVIRSLEKLNKNFDIANKECPYARVIRALRMVVDVDIKQEEMVKKEGYNA